MLQPIEKQYLQIGYIARSHGVNGEVVILPERITPQLFNDIDLAHIQDARGDLIPARIESVRVQQKNNRLSFFVKFEHVTDRNQAEELKGFAVYIKRDKTGHLIEDDDTSADYASFNVYDESERPVGVVNRVIENPAHPILEITTRNDTQLLVPFVDEYVVSSDEKNRVIVCQNLDQLTDV